MYLCGNCCSAYLEAMKRAQQDDPQISLESWKISNTYHACQRCKEQHIQKRAEFVVKVYHDF